MNRAPIERLRRNPDSTELSAPAKAALWIGSIATIVTGTGVLLNYFWPLPTEHLYYRGVMFSVNKSGSTWTGSFSYGSNAFNINANSRDGLLARVQWQIDAILGGVPTPPTTVAGFRGR